ncbi:MAG: Rrf2 family transcriptional regulator [Gemmatimonadetes bacterium]|nr:MAG: Rrf2 family transcriptional regulator [Gemmatimonadota bacterium]
MLSQTAVYALRAVLYLSERGAEEPVRVDDIARDLDVPRNYLSKILHALARDGVLASLRGPRGGFSLAVPAARLPLARVVEVFDDLGDERRCLLGRPVCSDHTPCAAHARWKSIATQVRAFFSETTVADLSPNDVDALRAVSAVSGSAGED